MPLLGLPPLRPNFDAAERDVAAKNPAMRVQAAERLGDATDEERSRAIRALKTMLGDPHPQVRCAAIEAVCRLEAPALHGDVIALVEDVDPTVREIAVASLERLGGETAIAAARDALKSPHPETRFQAALSFVELCPDDAAPLAELVRDEDPMVRINAAQALGQSHDPAATALLLQSLADHNRDVRRRAAIALAQRGDDRGGADLISALDDDELILEALDALGAIGMKSAADVIAGKSTGLFQPLMVRAAAGAALARIGDPRGVTVLRRVLNAWRPDGRNLVVEVAGNVGIADLVPDLLRLIDHRRGTDRPTLARALAQLASLSPGALEGLETLAAEPSEAGEIARKALKTHDTAR